MNETEIRLLEQAAVRLLGQVKNSYTYPNLFLWAHEPRLDQSNRLFKQLEAAVAQEFTYTVAEFPLQELIPDCCRANSATVITGIAVDTRKIERFRDLLKSVLWINHYHDVSPRRLFDLLTLPDDRPVIPFRLQQYGLFSPYRVKRQQQIRTHSFPHDPGYYRYRLCTHKTDILPVAFREFLDLVFENCPNHLYTADGFRASQQYSRLNTELQHTRQHQLIDFARQSRTFTRFSGRHDNVEYYCLEHDPHAIACEIPVWMEMSEIADYYDVFQTDLPLTGHIDLLRYEDGQIGVWDYKPRAAREYKAAMQVFLYALMLSVRTGISLRRFRCGYFDEHDAYLFNPFQAQFAPPNHRATPP